MRIEIWNSLRLLLLILAVTVIQADKDLTEDPQRHGIHPCFVEKDNLNECLVKALQIIFVNWKDGPPGTNTTGPVDPFGIKKIALLSNASDKGITIKADMENIIVKGTSKTTFLAASFNPKENKARALLHIPKLIIDFDYRIQINVFELDKKDTGHMEIDNLVIALEADLNPLYNPRTVDFVKQVKVSIRDVFNFKVKLNRFGGEKHLEENTDDLLNKKFYQAWKPAIEHVFGAIVTGRSKKIFSYVPAEYLIDEDEWDEDDTYFDKSLKDSLKKMLENSD